MPKKNYTPLYAILFAILLLALIDFGFKKAYNLKATVTNIDFPIKTTPLQDAKINETKIISPVGNGISEVEGDAKRVDEKTGKEEIMASKEAKNEISENPQAEIKIPEESNVANATAVPAQIINDNIKLEPTLEVKQNENTKEIDSTAASTSSTQENDLLTNEAIASGNSSEADKPSPVQEKAAQDKEIIQAVNPQVTVNEEIKIKSSDSIISKDADVSVISPDKAVIDPTQKNVNEETNNIKENVSSKEVSIEAASTPNANESGSKVEEVAKNQEIQTNTKEEVIVPTAAAEENSPEEKLSPSSINKEIEANEVIPENPIPISKAENPLENAKYDNSINEDLNKVSHNVPQNIEIQAPVAVPLEEPKSTSISIKASETIKDINKANFHVLVGMLLFLTCIAALAVGSNAYLKQKKSSKFDEYKANNSSYKFIGDEDNNQELLEYQEI